MTDDDSLTVSQNSNIKEAATPASDGISGIAEMVHSQDYRQRAVPTVVVRLHFSAFIAWQYVLAADGAQFCGIVLENLKLCTK